MFRPGGAEPFYLSTAILATSQLCVVPILSLDCMRYIFELICHDLTICDSAQEHCSDDESYSLCASLQVSDYS